MQFLCLSLSLFLIHLSSSDDDEDDDDCDQVIAVGVGQLVNPGIRRRPGACLMYSSYASVSRRSQRMLESAPGKAAVAAVAAEE